MLNFSIISLDKGSVFPYNKIRALKQACMAA